MKTQQALCLEYEYKLKLSIYDTFKILCFFLTLGTLCSGDVSLSISVILAYCRSLVSLHRSFNLVYYEFFFRNTCFDFFSYFFLFFDVYDNKYTLFCHVNKLYTPYFH